MIKSFKGKETQGVWEGRGSRRLPENIQSTARRKLRMINNARALTDLKVPPGNRLEAMKIRGKGQYSLRINEQWHICFVWQKGDAYNVEIVDYH